MVKCVFAFVCVCLCACVVGGGCVVCVGENPNCKGFVAMET